MSEQRIEPVAIVKVKSGGPNMTVGSIQLGSGGGKGTVRIATCVWFVSPAGECRTAEIPVDALTLVAPS